MQCIDFQVVRYYSEVGTKNPLRRDEERKPPTDCREVSSGLPINSAALSLPLNMPNMCRIVIWGIPPSQVLFQVPLSWARSTPIVGDLSADFRLPRCHTNGFVHSGKRIAHYRFVLAFSPKEGQWCCRRFHASWFRPPRFV